jgi:hypothetical protein
MKKITTIFTMVLLAGLSWQTNAQNGGDTCTTAVMIEAGDVTGTEINDLSGGSNGGDSAWFVFTAPSDGALTINSCLGGVDTRLWLWADCADGASTANDDDTCPFAPDGSGSSWASEIANFEVLSGEDYFIQWDDRWTGSEGPFNWSVTFTSSGLANDDCAGAIAVACDETVTGSTADATDSGSNPSPDVWYSYSGGAGTITLSLCDGGTDYDSYLRVFDACDGMEIAFNDDFCAAQSEVTFEANGMSTYYIMVEGFSNSSGNYSMAITCEPAVDECPAAMNITATSITETTADIAWDVVPEAVDGYQVGVYNAGTDDLAYVSPLLAAGTVMDTATGLSSDSMYEAVVVSICSLADEVGTISERVPFSTTTAGLANDDCAGAIAVACDETVTGSTADATDSGSNAAPDVWYSYSGEAGTITVSLCDGGTDYDSYLRIFDACDGAEIVNNDDSCGLQSEVAFEADGTSTYYIMVEGFGSNSGNYSMAITCEPAGSDCNAAANIAISDITDVSAVVSWDDEATAVDGYQVGVYNAGTDDLAYVSPLLAAGTVMDTATGLSSDSMYEAVVVSICSLAEEVFIVSERFAFSTIALGLADSAIVGYTVSPNPAKNSINLNAAFSIENVIVSNVLGQKVMTNKGGSAALTLDISNLQVGTYFMKATVNGIDVVERFIKQ